MSSPIFVPGVVMIRHAQSEWNLQNRSTGWADVELTPGGVFEARQAGRRLAAAGRGFDVVYTSLLKRSRHTARLLLESLGTADLPMYANWRLNERHYGALEGLNKDGTQAKYGPDQFQRWRRGYADRPPALASGDERCPVHKGYAAAVPAYAFPRTESLADTEARVVPLWDGVIKPQMHAGRRVLVVSHGNTMRALARHIEGLDVPAVEALEFPTATPVVYRFDARGRFVERSCLEGPCDGPVAHAA